MKSKDKNKVRMNFTIDKEIADKFREICETKSTNMSSLLEKFMKNFVDKFKKP